MKSFTIRLAGQYFTICPVCDYIREYCRDYIVADDTEDAMRFRIATTQSDIDFEREKSAREDTKEGIPIRCFSDAYLETLAVYRKIADHLLLLWSSIFVTFVAKKIIGLLLGYYRSLPCM